MACNSEEAAYLVFIQSVLPSPEYTERENFHQRGKISGSMPSHPILHPQPEKIHSQKRSTAGAHLRLPNDISHHCSSLSRPQRNFSQSFFFFLS